MTKRVLVIDDEASVRKAFELALGSIGYAVSVAENGALGLERYDREGADLVFLDLKMPVLDGIGVLRGLRERHNDLPVYILTAFDRQFFECLTQARRDGLAFDLVRKPIGRQQIIEIAQGVLEGATVMQEPADD